MNEKRAYFLPRFFEPTSRYNSVDAFKGLANLDNLDVLFPNLLDQKNIDRSMRWFAEKIITSGEFYEHLDRQIKLKKLISGNAPDPRRINLISVGDKSSRDLATDFLGEINGSYGFLMFEGNPKEKKGAGIFFSLIQDEYWVSQIASQGLDRRSLQQNDLIICQIQGGKDHLEGVLNPYRWEFVVVNLVSLWAHQVGFPWVLLLPSANNFYFRDRDPERQRQGKMRYEVTGRRCGFRKELENGPLILRFKNVVQAYQTAFSNQTSF